ncbi:hypothetical protein A2U01_0110913, partial [Trifolium medium]|nr:hypothetical protein [Trifolium medium]
WVSGDEELNFVVLEGCGRCGCVVWIERI